MGLLWSVLFSMSLSGSLFAESYSFNTPGKAHHIAANSAPITELSLSSPDISVTTATSQLAGKIDLNAGRVMLQRNTVCSIGTQFATGGTIAGVHTDQSKLTQLQLPSQSSALLLPEKSVLGAPQTIPDIFPEHAVVALDWWALDSQWGVFADTTSLFVCQRNGMSYSVATSSPIEGTVRGIFCSPKNLTGVVVVEPKSGAASAYSFSYNKSANELLIEPLGVHAGEITAAAWSLDGRQFFLADYNKSQQAGWKMQIALYRASDEGMQLAARQYIAQPKGTMNVPYSYRVLSVAWRSDGKALLVGCGWHEESEKATSRRPHAQVLLFDVQGSDIMLVSSIDDIAANVSALTFLPGQKDRCLIGLSHGGGNNRIRSCTVQDNEEGVPHLRRERSYPFAGNIVRMSCHQGGALLAVEDVKEASKTRTLRLYKLNDLNITQCAEYPHIPALQNFVWGQQKNPFLYALFQDDSRVDAVVMHDGMTFENLHITGDSDVVVRGDMQLVGSVLVDGKGRVWKSGANTEWRLGRKSIVRFSDIALAASGTLTLSGPTDAECQLYNVHLYNGSLYCQVPTIVITSLHAHGTVAGALRFQPHSRLILSGPLNLEGKISIDGNVTIEGNGHELDMTKAHITIAAGGTLKVHNAKVKGCEKALEMRDTSSVAFDQGSIIELVDKGRFEKGMISLDQSTLVHQHWRYNVSSFTLHADNSTELWREAQKHGVWQGAAEPGTQPTQTSIGTTEHSVLPFLPPSTITGMGVIEVGVPHYYLDNDLFLAPDTASGQGTRLHITTNTVIHGNYRRIFCAIQSDEPLITVDSMCHVTFVDVALESFRPHMIAPTAKNTTAKVTWGQNSWVNLRGDGALQLPWKLGGNGHIDGNSHQISLQARAPLIVDSASNVVIERLTVNNVAGRSITALDDSSIVTLSNVTLHTSDTVQIPNGEWNFYQNVSFIGPHAVIYASARRAMIHENAMLIFDNNSTNVIPNDFTTTPYTYTRGTLVYAPTINRLDGIQCHSKGTLALYNSELFCNDRSLHIPEGRVLVDGNVSLREEGDGALILGGSADGQADEQTPRVSLEYRNKSANIHVFGHIVMTLSR